MTNEKCEMINGRWVRRLSNQVELADSSGVAGCSSATQETNSRIQFSEGSLFDADARGAIEAGTLAPRGGGFVGEPSGGARECKDSRQRTSVG